MRKFACLFLLVPGFASAQMLGPSSYVQFSDSPFFGGSFGYFYLEDMEDDLFSQPGVTKSGGTITDPSGITDSVDADDGVIDGSGTAGRSLFSGSGSAGITFTFDALVLGALPTHAGIVWTDGAGEIGFEARDAGNNLIGSLSGTHADGFITGQTAEDRFYGVQHAAGIKSIKIWNASGGIEVDHLQYGGEAPVPEPATMALVAASALAAIRKRRR